MSVTLELSAVLASFTGDQLTVPVDGKTIVACLNALVKKFPKLKKLLLDKSGRLTHFYEVFLNGERVYPLDMNQPLADGDKLNIVYIITGG